MEYSQHECTQHSARTRAHTGVHAWGMRHLLLLGAQARGHTWSQAEAAYFYPNLLRPLRKDLHVADLGHGGTFRFGLLRSPTRSLKEDTLNRSAMPSHRCPQPCPRVNHAFARGVQVMGCWVGVAVAWAVRGLMVANGSA